jgi:hypothetical protein
MRPGIVASSAGESTSSVGILGGLLYGFEGVILTVMYSVTGWVDRAVPPTPFPRTQGISAREMLS